MMRRSAGLLAAGSRGSGALASRTGRARRVVKEPTAAGTRRRGGDRRRARDARRRSTTLQARRQRRRRGRRRGRRARRHRAVLVRHRRRRLHGHPRRAQRQGHDDRRPRDGAGGDDARLVLRERRAAARSTTRAAAACRPACPARVARLGARRSTATARSRCARRSARHRGRAPRLRRRPDVLRPDRRQRRPTSTTSRRPRRSTSTPTARRATSARALRNPDLARDVRAASAALGAERGFYRGPIADAIVAGRPAPADRRRRRPPVAPGPDDGATTCATTGAVPRADAVAYRGLDVWGMGPPSSGGSTVGEALNILEGYRDFGRDRVQSLHRYLEASRLRVRRPQRLPRRPGVLRRAAARPAVGLVRGRAARADHRRQAANAAVPAGDPYDNGGPGRTTATVSHPSQSTTHLTVADRKGNVVSYTFTIESTGGNGIVVPGYGLPAQQRADGLQLRLDDAPEPAPRAASGRAARWRRRSCTRHGKPFLAIGSPGGSHDHHDRAADAHRPARPRHDAAAGDRRAARVSQRNGADDRRPSRRSSARRTAQALASELRPRVRAAGAAGRDRRGRPAIEFLQRRHASSPPPSRPAAAAAARWWSSANEVD